DPQPAVDHAAEPRPAGRGLPGSRDPARPPRRAEDRPPAPRDATAPGHPGELPPVRPRAAVAPRAGRPQRRAGRPARLLRAAGRSFVLRARSGADLAPVMLAVDWFRRALLNLILSAEHAMPDGGELILTTRREGRWDVAEITDTGSGMSAEILARAFDPFYS